jgi:hypothetical protein
MTMIRNLARRKRWLLAGAFLASLWPFATVRAQEVVMAPSAAMASPSTMAPTMMMAPSSCASGSCASCSTGYCQTHHCPPPLQHCMEGAPHIRVKCGCPKPICNPCSQPGWGYYETCWSPWPWPRNYGHCPTVPPAATVALSGPGGIVDQVVPYGATSDVITSPVPGPQQRMMPPSTATSPMPYGTGAMPYGAAPMQTNPVPSTPMPMQTVPMPMPSAPMRPSPMVVPQSPGAGNSFDNLPTPRPLPSSPPRNSSQNYQNFDNSIETFPAPRPENTVPRLNAHPTNLEGF